MEFELKIQEIKMFEFGLNLFRVQTSFENFGKFPKILT
jgi:hypothetical protein